MEISVARLSWGIENDLTQRVSLRDPVAVTRITLTSQRLDLVHWDRAIAVFEVVPLENATETPGCGYRHCRWSMSWDTVMVRNPGFHLHCGQGS